MSSPTSDIEPPSPEPSAESQDVSSARPSFAVKVTIPGRSHVQGQSDFWDALLSRPPAAGVVAYDDRFERDLREKFGGKLVSEARLFRDAHLKDYPQYAPAAPQAFSFKVRNIRYGSLLFDVAVGGAGALAKYLFNDPELVLAFLDTCVPRAFASSVGLVQAGRADVDVVANDALIRAIQHPVSVDTAGEPTHKATWADVMQRASQIAWLLPTILALAVLYVAAGMLSGEIDRIHAREKALDDRNQQLQSSYDERIVKIEALTLDLVKQLRLPKEERKPDTCCPGCCPVLQCNPHPPERKKSLPLCNK